MVPHLSGGRGKCHALGDNRERAFAPASMAYMGSAAAADNGSDPRQPDLAGGGLQPAERLETAVVKLPDRPARRLADLRHR